MKLYQCNNCKILMNLKDIKFDGRDVPYCPACGATIVMPPKLYDLYHGE